MKHETAQERGHRQLRDAGYKRARGGSIEEHDEAAEAKADASADAKMVTKGVHEHEAKLHKGEAKTKLKLRRGGSVPGEKSEARPDRRARGGPLETIRQGHVKEHAGLTQLSREGKIAGEYARGGHVGGKKAHKVIINVNGQQGDPMREQMAHRAGVQQGLAIGARSGAGAGAPRPPGPPGPGLAPAGPPMMPGAAPGGPPPMMPPRPMPPPGVPGAGAGAMPMPMPIRRDGGVIRRDERGRFLGGAI